MHKIKLCAPEIEGQTATFRWSVDPTTSLYTRSSFQLAFPSLLNLSRVPSRLWWDILLICLHQHWLLLRPCQIQLPLELSVAEKAFWLQLLQSAADTLESTRSERRPAQPLGIDFDCGSVKVPHSKIDGSGYGTAFSGGKDSLLQAALLCELTKQPLLVTTTSPLPTLADHKTARRRQVLAAIKKRRDCVFVEVVSDFRSNWDNGFCGRNGYTISVNELTDTFLYMSSLLAAGAAHGRTRLFLASEAEVQENAEVDGKIIQHPHYMYSAATQRALSRYLEPYGIFFGSLIWPLYSMQVQQLLWTRYKDLSDLQYSCWRVEEGQATCSRCEQCMRIAMTALAAGHNPERMGIDLGRLMSYSPEWAPIGQQSPSIPQMQVRQRAGNLVAGAINRTGTLKLAIIYLRSNPQKLFSVGTWQMFAAYRRLRNRVRSLPEAPDLGVREAFLDWLDPNLRDRLISIYETYFPFEQKHRHLKVFERSRILTERATSALNVHVSQ